MNSNNYDFKILLSGDHHLLDNDKKNLFYKKEFEIDNCIIKVSISKHHPKDMYCWERCKSIRDLYYYNLYGVIFVYDTCNVESFQSIINLWYKEYENYKISKIYKISDYQENYKKIKDTFKPSLFLMGVNYNSNLNKSVTTEDALQFAQSINADFQESNDLNENLYGMVKKIKLNYDEAIKLYQQNLNIQLNNNNNNNDSIISKCLIN